MIMKKDKTFKIGVFIPSYLPDDIGVKEKRKEANLKLINQLSNVNNLDIRIFSQNYKDEDYIANISNLEYIDIPLKDIGYARRKIRDYITDENIYDFAFLLDDDVFFDEDFIEKIEKIEKIIDSLINVSITNNIALISLTNNNVNILFSNVLSNVNYKDNSIEEINLISIDKEHITAGTLFINLRLFPYHELEFEYCDDEAVYSNLCYHKKLQYRCLDKTILSSCKERYSVLPKILTIRLDKMYNTAKDLIDYNIFLKDILSIDKDSTIIKYSNYFYSDMIYTFLLIKMSKLPLFKNYYHGLLKNKVENIDKINLLRWNYITD